MLNCAFGPLLRYRRLPSAFAQVAALSWALALGAASSAMGATVVLDDFEDGIGGMKGQLMATGPIAATPKPGRQLGMRLDLAGRGGCDQLIGSSQALCGADTKKWAGYDGAILKYDINFNGIASILFDLAAFSDDDPFDHQNGENANDWGDYLRISSVIDGTKTLLAEFTGVPQSERTPETAFGMVSTDAGTLLGDGVIADATFDTIKLAGVQSGLTGKGALLFEIRSTGSSEQVGLDNIRFAEVPLPAALSFSLIGLAILVTSSCVHSRRRRATL